MKTTIRDTTDEDTDAIFALRWDDRLRTMNYRPSIFETPHTLIALSQTGMEIPASGMKSSTILVDDQFAGHIMQLHKTGFDTTIRIELGWNLVPRYWGKGIMVEAVNQLLQQRFKASSKINFFACCFASNRRCIRVIEKLGFQPDKLTLLERMFHFTKTWGRERIIKHRLTYEDWFKRGQKESD